jgi:hypothetical protein
MYVYIYLYIYAGSASLTLAGLNDKCECGGSLPIIGLSGKKKRETSPGYLKVCIYTYIYIYIFICFFYTYIYTYLHIFLKGEDENLYRNT